MDCPRCARPVAFVAIKLRAGEFRLYDCAQCEVHAWVHDGETAEVPSFLSAVARHYDVPQSERPDFVEEVVMQAGTGSGRPPQQKLRLAPSGARTQPRRPASAA